MYEVVSASQVLLKNRQQYFGSRSGDGKGRSSTSAFPWSDSRQ